MKSYWSRFCAALKHAWGTVVALLFTPVVGVLTFSFACDYIQGSQFEPFFLLRDGLRFLAVELAVCTWLIIVLCHSRRNGRKDKPDHDDE